MLSDHRFSLEVKELLIGALAIFTRLLLFHKALVFDFSGLMVQVFTTM